MKKDKDKESMLNQESVITEIERFQRSAALVLHFYLPEFKTIP